MMPLAARSGLAEGGAQAQLSYPEVWSKYICRASASRALISKARIVFVICERNENTSHFFVFMICVRNRFSRREHDICHLLCLTM